MKTYIHVFYVENSIPDQPRGWYYAFGCEPNCLPEGDPMGPFPTEDMARKEGEDDLAQCEIDILADIDEDGFGFFAPRLFDANDLDCRFQD